MVKITVDGITVEVPEGINLIEAARFAGVEIPYFCYHPALRVVGQCRVCLVEVEGVPKLSAACCTLVKDGMVVRTDTERVKKIRAQVMEFLLIHHPLDCPVCDQAGECDLQDFTEAHSFPKSRYTEEKRITPGLERRQIGPHVFQNQNRCIHCSRCIRVARDIAETGELTFAERGYRAVIETQDGRPLDNPWSACCADVCPVGALTVYDFRFRERVWNLSSSPSICPHCGNGCNIELDHREGVVKRFRPRLNPDINHYWLCDHGRFSYDWMNGGEMFEPRINGEVSDWNEALEKLKNTLSAGGKSLALVSPFQTVEEMALLQILFDEVHLLHPFGEERKIKNEAGEWLASRGTGPNVSGADRLSIHPLERIPGDVKVLFIAENPYPSPVTEELISSLPAGAFLAVDSRLESPLVRKADLVLPGALFQEKEGVYVNDHGWGQLVETVCPMSLGIRTMTSYLLDLMKTMGIEAPGETSEQIFASLQWGVTHADLPVRLEETGG